MSYNSGECDGEVRMRGARAADGVRGRRGVWWWVVLLWLVVGALSLWCASAQALVARGHVFDFAFGGAGGGGGGLSDPAGVAVSEASGDVYVVDRANDRVERFGVNGEFVAAWGWGVRDGKKEYEICEAGCEAGIAGSGKGQFDFPAEIAVDNSTSVSDPSRGDVYVVADGRSEHGRLEKFTAAGELVGSVREEGGEAWEGTLDGVGVDGQGGLWVYRGSEAEGVVERFSSAVKNAFEEPVLESSVFCPKPGFALDATGEAVYVDHERENSAGGCPLEEGEPSRPVVTAKLKRNGEEALETVAPALDPLQSAGVAVEASDGEVPGGEVYVSNVSTLAAFTAAGSLIQRIALPGEDPAGNGIAVDGVTRRLYVTDAAAGTVDVFAPEPPGPPSVSDLEAQNITPTSTGLSALVDPDGSDTHYYFQYGTADCVSSPGSCVDVPAAPGTDAGEGFADQSAGVELQGLRASTTYYYRLIAVNEHGEAQGADTFGSITTLPSATGVLLDGRAWEMVSPAEKDGSGIEPLRDEGGLIQASEDGGAITYVANGPIVAEPEGSRAPYPTQALATRSSVSGWSSAQIVTPRTKGEGFIPGEAPEYRFFSPDLSFGLVQPDNQAQIEPFEQPPLAPEATEKTMYVRDSASGGYLPLVTAANDTAGTQFGQQLEFVSATPDLSSVVFASEVPLSAGAGAGLYEWHSGAPLASVSVLPDGAPALEPALGANDHNVRGAVSSDGSRVFWTGSEELQAGETTEVVRHLYMREMVSGETLQLDAAVPPVQEPGEEESEVGFQAASGDGSRVFFTDTARLTEDSNLEPVAGATDNPADLYECEIYEEAGGPKCRLSDLTVDQDGLESAGVLDLLPAVSQDGAYVYFVANGVLAPGATPGDCVRVNTEEPASPGASCNLYVWNDGRITFIASLSDEDGPDWGRSEAVIKGGESSIEPLQDLADVTAGISPDGEYLAFMSDRPLTGYDNVDVNPVAKGARDEEVYLYDASSKLLVCASCNPNGQPPDGVFDSEQAGEGLGLLVDRREDWSYKPKTMAPTAHWLAGSIPGWTPLGWASDAQALRQPRYLSDSGRLFFDSTDPLEQSETATPTRPEQVDGQTTQVGVESVYEYEPNRTGTCLREEGCTGLVSSGTSQQESAFLDASTSGDEAFFLTAQPLVAADHDTNFDLYDARVCTTQSPCLTGTEASPRPCENTSSCRASSSPAPAVLGPSGSATYSGPASQSMLAPKTTTSPPKGKPSTLTRSQKLTAALKKCKTHWKHSKKRRAACERHARKTYAPRKRNTHKKGKK